MRALAGLPELIVTVAGRRLPATEAANIITIRVRSALGQPTQCQLAWAAEGQLGFDPAVGDALKVELGGQRSPLFIGEVTVVEYAYAADTGRQLRVRGYDALHRLRNRQSSQLHADTDLAGLVTALAGGTGLSVEAPAVQLGDVYQCGRSDLDLLLEQSARVGRYPVVTGGTLRLADLVGEGEPVELTYGQQIHSAEVEVSGEPAFRSAEVTWWRPGPAAAEERTAASGSGGAAVSADPAPDRVGGGGPLVRLDELAPAADLAQAELDVRRAGEVTATVVAEGNPRLQAGGRVRLKGLRSALEGDYPITEAVHEISATGYETTVSTRPPAGPPPRPADQVTLGVVTDVADPEDRGRVRVRLPAYPGLTSPWAPVLLPAAGQDKGVVALPADDDTVLVLLPGRDPAHAVVLGGLYGGVNPPAADSADRGRTMLLRTADGQQVSLDAVGHTISLTDGHGSEVRLAPDLLRITSATDLLIEAPGKALRVRALTVDFEEAT